MQLIQLRLGIVFMSAAIMITHHAATAMTDEKLQVTHQGVERTATLHRSTSDGQIPDPRPTIIVLHGLEQSVDSLRRQLRFDQVAERERAIVVYPEALQGRWSYGRPIVAPMPTVGDVPADDVGFIGTLIDALVNRRLADAKRVYVTGGSRGGLMTFTLACALPHRIAAAAPMLTGMTEWQREDCTPGHPVPLFVVAGTNDRMQAYDGGIGPLGRLLSVPETIEFWRTRHGCTSLTFKLLPDVDTRDRTRIAIADWTGCKSGMAVRLYRIEGGGHRLPSLVPLNDRPDYQFGLRSRDMETAETLWAVFKDIALP